MRTERSFVKCRFFQHAMPGHLCLLPRRSLLLLCSEAGTGPACCSVVEGHTNGLLARFHRFFACGDSRDSVLPGSVLLVVASVVGCPGDGIAVLLGEFELGLGLLKSCASCLDTAIFLQFLLECLIGLTQALRPGRRGVIGDIGTGRAPALVVAFCHWVYAHAFLPFFGPTAFGFAATSCCACLRTATMRVESGGLRVYFTVAIVVPFCWPAPAIRSLSHVGNLGVAHNILYFLCHKQLGFGLRQSSGGLVPLTWEGLELRLDLRQSGLSGFDTGLGFLYEFKIGHVNQPFCWRLSSVTLCSL